jgi:F0F1-type ATP synthase assembly protein I
MEQSDNNPRNILNTLLIVLIGQVGCLTIAIVLASVFGGLWLDKTFGTKPFFTLALLIAGIPVSVLLMLFISRRTLARMKLQSESKSNSNENSALGDGLGK